MFIDKTRDFHEFLSLILKAFNELPRFEECNYHFFDSKHPMSTG